MQVYKTVRHAIERATNKPVYIVGFDSSHKNQYKGFYEAGGKMQGWTSRDLSPITDHSGPSDQLALAHCGRSDGSYQPIQYTPREAGTLVEDLQGRAVRIFFYVSGHDKPYKGVIDGQTRMVSFRSNELSSYPDTTRWSALQVAEDVSMQVKYYTRTVRMTRSNGTPMDVFAEVGDMYIGINHSSGSSYVEAVPASLMRD